MIASFWGWMDAFAARVGIQVCTSGACLEALPILRSQPFSAICLVPNLFSGLARTAPTLTLTAMDLVTQNYLTKELGHTLTRTIDHGSKTKPLSSSMSKAII